MNASLELVDIVCVPVQVQVALVETLSEFSEPEFVLVIILLNSAFRSALVSVSLLDQVLTLLYVAIIYLDGGVVPARERDFSNRLFSLVPSCADTSVISNPVSFAKRSNATFIGVLGGSVFRNSFAAGGILS